MWKFLENGTSITQVANIYFVLFCDISFGQVSLTRHDEAVRIVKRALKTRLNLHEAAGQSDGLIKHFLIEGLLTVDSRNRDDFMVDTERSVYCGKPRLATSRVNLHRDLQLS